MLKSDIIISNKIGELNKASQMQSLHQPHLQISQLLLNRSSIAENDNASNAPNHVENS